jgi:glycerol-3-phosphate acyltransferase PlsX
VPSTISAARLFTAGRQGCGAGCTTQVTATGVTNSPQLVTVTNTATVTSNLMAPLAPSVPELGTQAFTATRLWSDACTEPVPGVVWGKGTDTCVTVPSTVSAAGLLTAGRQGCGAGCTTQVTATVVTNSPQLATITNTATVTSTLISPVAPSVPELGTQAFVVNRTWSDAFVTAGNTGGAMANALFRIGRIRGVRRPALAGIFPVRNGQAVLLDIGANADVRPEFLVQFALFGSLYAETVFGWPSPRVALLSNGEESGKGNQLVKEAYPLLQAAGLNFIGNIEPKEFFAGKADVAVSDGFTGNVLLKTSEAVASFLINMIREQIKASPLTAVGGLLAKPAFKRVGALLDPSEYGAAPLLGIDGLVFVGHGRSDAHALVSAIRVARQAVAGGLLPAMRREIHKRLASSAPGDSE